MARRSSSKGRLKVKVEGLEQLAKIPGFLEHGQRRFLEKASGDLRDLVAAAAPGGAGGGIGRSARARTLSSTKAEIVLDHPGAKALEEGAFIKPRGGRRRLKFRVGGRTVFAPSVRLKPRHYARRALRKRNQVVRAAFNQAFDQLGER